MKKISKEAYEHALKVKKLYEDQNLFLAGRPETLPKDLERSWPTKDVLSKLIQATEYLLHVGNYDSHDHEELNICVIRGKEILANIGRPEEKEEKKSFCRCYSKRSECGPIIRKELTCEKCAASYEFNPNNQ